MKKLLFTFALGFGLMYFAFSQSSPFTLNGYVFDSLYGSGPLKSKTVYVYVDSNSSSWMYNNSTSTDNAGHYSLTITPPAGHFFNFHAYVFDCYNHTLVYSFTNSSSSIYHDFAVCDILTMPVKADFSFYTSSIKYQVSFNDLSTGNISNWWWKFGDGIISTLKYPVHTYSGVGAYSVWLIVRGVNSSLDSINKIVNVVDSTSNFCTASFSSNINNLTVNFSGIASDSTGTTYYHWDFGDGHTGSGQYPVHTYSTVAKYSVCLTTTSFHSVNDSCVAKYCNDVDLNPPPTPHYAISGEISNGSNSVDHAKVFLIYYNPLDSTLTAIDTVYSVDSFGTSFYYFGNVPAGSYLVKAALTSSSTNYIHCMPTYYGNVLYWDLATYTTVNSSNKYVKADIILITGTNPGGPGFIGGKTSQGAKAMYSPGDPIPEIEVLLIDNSTNTPVAFDYTDVNGHFDFSNIAYGTYKVYAEIAGKTTIPPIVKINTVNPSVNNVNILIGTKVITGIFDNRVAGILNGTSRIYPDPSSGNINIDLTLIRTSSIAVNIINQTGQLVYQSNAKYTSGRQQITINTESLSSGLYILNLRTEDGGYVTRQFMVK